MQAGVGAAHVCAHLSALTAARSSSRRGPPFSFRERERALGSARGGGPEGRAGLPRGSGRRSPPMPRNPAGAAAAVGGGAALRRERAAPPPARGVSGRVGE